MRFRASILAFVIASVLPAQGGKAHRVVVEVNVPGTAAYTTVLGNVENLLKAFAPEQAQVEIVCHGAGIGLLQAKDKRMKDRIVALQRKGVAFSVCSNTLRGKHIDIKSLCSGVQVVKSGVYEVVIKQEDGWSYLKGAY